MNGASPVEVPEGQDLLQGMPWLKTNNPDIDWVQQQVQSRLQSDDVDLPSPKKTNRDD
ncbi:Hypothetical protein PHPALM_16883 [Phytophthora palmivora]|uniref:Uncharacterized protein n=1 Tax=Phytophthora palmivora TaxID=4796 RepID=A0A2P4XNM9_9STRA|nr:Hypothetical protein PHPALM_16883 [Phytophthora palmivora]